MPIRLKLSLFYTVILSITLLVFGWVLYTTQAQSTLASLKDDLMNSSIRFKDIPQLGQTSQKFDNQKDPPSPKSFTDLPKDSNFSDIKEKEIVRIVDSEGNLLFSPSGDSDEAIPLSEEGLNVLLSGSDWWEIENVSDEEMLIYSRPITLDDGSFVILQLAHSLTERNRTLTSLKNTLLISSAIAILIAFGVGFFMSKISLQPIKRITKTAKTIGEETDFSKRVSYQGPSDEIGELASTFNIMLSHLENSYNELGRSLNLQREFIADVSHELRTPLTTIRGNLGLLNRKPSLDEETQAEILDDMILESDRLIRLVNDLLTLARTEAHRTLVKQPVKINQIVEETVRQVKNNYQNRDIKIIESLKTTVSGDRDALKQVVLILLDNAVKHSENEIDIKIVEENQKIKLTVQDHGNGISQEKLDHIFDRFYREQEKRTKNKVSGFGLGLPIAKALMDQMDAEILVSSEEDVGTQISLILEKY